jgi:hypothetical protein
MNAGVLNGKLSLQMSGKFLSKISPVTVNSSGNPAITVK